MKQEIIFLSKYSKSKRSEKVCTNLNHIEHFFVVASSNTEYISISAFASLVGITIGNTSSALRL